MNHLNYCVKFPHCPIYDVKSCFCRDSHELRTPMAAVIGLLDILMCDDCLTNEQYATITQIRKCSTALLRLLNNILDLSKVRNIEKSSISLRFLTEEEIKLGGTLHTVQIGPVLY